MSDTAGEDRKTQRDNGGHGHVTSAAHDGMYAGKPPAHAVHGHGHVGRGQDGKAPGDPHHGETEGEEMSTETAADAEGKEKKHMGEGSTGSNSNSAQASTEY